MVLAISVATTSPTKLCPGATELHPRETQDAAINGDTIA
jgi:hypothetical protein